MLPLASEYLAATDISYRSLFMSGMIVAPQLVVAILAPWVGYFCELWGRKRLLALGFAVQIIRAGLFAFVTNPAVQIFVQLLDGISGAVLTVLTIVIVSDLTTGTGRFNLAAGGVGLVSTAAASLSTAVSGYVAQELGREAGFLSLALVAAIGTLLVWFKMRETKPERYAD
jgi:MFS family permease